ncbi:MAG TPA: S8 family peptidase [bacterium]|jgi:subtilisin family serine protease
MIRLWWIGCLLIAASAFAAVPASIERAAREVVIKWRTPPSRLDALTAMPEFAGRTESVRAALPITERTEQGLERVSVLVATSRQAAEEIVAGLQGDPRVDYAELRPERHTDDYTAARRGGNALDGVPNDPFYTQQWALPAVDAEAAWNITRGDTNVVIAVVDVGVDFTHPDLAAQRWVNWAEVHGQPGVDDDGNGYIDDLYGYDFVDGDGDPTPNPRLGPETHGTHVAGIAAATRNNGIGISGLAPGCKVMGVRAGAGGGINFGYDGIYYACRSGAKIINCSWGGSDASGFEQDVLAYVMSHGCVVVAAAGNDPALSREFPAGTEGVLATAASQIGDIAADFTTHGDWVKVTAPGVMILSTVIGPNGEAAYDYFQGTSMATPMAAATCALVASRFRNLDGRQIMERVILSSDPIDAMNPTLAGKLGLGRINAWRALSDSVAGVRLVNVTYTPNDGNNDTHIQGGETANLQISIFNDLGSAGNVIGRVSTTSDSVSLTGTIVDFGNVPHGGPFVNTTPLRIQVIGTARRGPIIPITVDFESGQRLIGRGTATVILDSTFVVADNGRLKLGFAENGSLGYFDYVRNQYLGPGWQISDHTNALYHGSFVMAADGAASDNFYNNHAVDSLPDYFDWAVLPDSVAHAVSSTRADYEARTTFDDRAAAEPLFAQVGASVLGWNSPGANGSLVLEYTVTNRSVNTWNQAYASLFLDIDLASAITNVAHYDTASGITYVEQIRPSHPLAGIVPLTDTLGTLYVIDNRAQIDPPTWGDSAKWHILTQGVQPTPTQPMDLSLALAIGPLTMTSHETRTFAYAMLTGQTIEDLRLQADSARARYGQHVLPPVPPTAPQMVAEKPRLFPNPLPQGEPLHLLVPDAQPVNLRLYNVLGQVVADLHGLRGGPNPIALDRGMLDNASGVLFYRIESQSGRVDGKLLILR